MCRSVALLALALVLAACGGGEAVDGLVPDPVPDPVLDQAVRVWRLGADALEPGREAEDPAERVVRTWQEGDLVIEEVETVEDPDPAPFTVLDEGAARFVRSRDPRTCTPL